MSGREQENLRSVGGSKVSEKSHGIGGENPELVSRVEGWRGDWARVSGRGNGQQEGADL